MFRVISDREWILTNGLGGYALGFGNMMNKRKYNGLLIASSKNLRRVHTVSSIEEGVITGGGMFNLDSTHYLNCIYPAGYSHIVNAWLRPYPAALYSSMPADRDLLILKEIFMLEGRNAVAVKYSNVGNKDFDLILRPKITLRDSHALNAPGSLDNIHLERQCRGNFFKAKRMDSGFAVHGYLSDGEAIEDYAIYRKVYYPVEAIRGYDSVEDLVAPFRLVAKLMPKKDLYVVFASEEILDPIEGAKMAEAHYKSLPLPANHPEKVPAESLVGSTEFENKDIFSKDAYYKILVQASKDFLIADDDIIAGYPWFGPWGRDTLISMGGLKHLPDGSRRAVNILRKYGGFLRNGVLPNTFGEGGEGQNYDSVDAPLWYVLRCHEYAPTNRDLFAYVAQIILCYHSYDRHPFYLSHDGLIDIRPGPHALTWMDAKIHGSPVTPRWGKPVEIEGLWYNALCAAREMAKKLNIAELHHGQYKLTIAELDRLIEKVKASLQDFVGANFLADRIEEGRPVWEIRPNAVIALSLPFDFVDRDVMKEAWKVAKAKLLTSFGLRSLDPSHPAFKQKYVGNQRQRDLAYHQGTVWGFLMLPFVKLTHKIFKDELSKQDLAKEIGSYLWAVRCGFAKGEIASVAEVWDGIDSYFPKGCPAQAWSVFALLEAEHLAM